MATTTTGRAANPSVGVIGCGFAGIAMGVRLLKAGITDFTIFEAADDIGGTWFHNTYPGAEVDTPSHMYSFSFEQNDWTRPFATQSELLGYLKRTAEKWGLLPHIQLNTRITSVVWDAERSVQRVTAEDGTEREFTAVISAMGLLNVPSHPSWAASETFGGTVVHTARWTPGLEWEGKRVAVVGTGSSAAQVVPAMAPAAGELLVFQRQPAWVDEKERSTFTPEQRAVLSTPRGYRKERARLFWNQEKNWFGGRVVRPGSKADARAVERCRAHITRSIPDPQLRAQLTPTGPYLAKRPVRSNEYLPALNRPNVTVIPRGVVDLDETGLVDAAGVHHDVDIVVTATGFRPAEFLLGLEVRGDGGRSIHDAWGDDPQAFLGIAVPGFPNFFMMYGPNTNFYAIVFNLERQADFITRTLKRMQRRKVSAVRVKQGYFEKFNELLQKRMAKTSFMQGQSYFRSASGRVVTQWPEGAVVYAALTRTMSGPAMEYRS